MASPWVCCWLVWSSPWSVQSLPTTRLRRLPAAHVKDDSGKGPPSYWYGWIRTGQSSSGSSTAGSGNCLNWTSTDSGEYGVAVRLSRTWETDPGDIFTWDATAFNCGSYIGPVWCVGDFYTVYLPLILQNYP